MRKHIKYNNDQIEQILFEIVSQGKKGRHEHYDRTVEVSEYLFKIHTGNYTEDQILCYKPRESPEQKVQRFNIDIPKTPSFLAKLHSPIDEIQRCDGLISDIKFANTDTTDRVESLQNELNCYGKGGLQKYLDDNVKRIETFDPNTFIVTSLIEENSEEFCYPIEITSPYVWNYEYSRDELQYVVTRTNTSFSELDEVDVKIAVDPKKSAENQKQSSRLFEKNYFKQSTTYTIYGANCAVELVFVPSDYTLTEADQEKYSGHEQINLEVEKVKSNFLYKKYEYLDTDVVPAVRVGSMLDAETNFETAVPYFWSVKHDLDKLINYNNEEVLIIAIHGILKTFNYVEECNHQIKTDKGILACDGGYYAGNSSCSQYGMKCSDCAGTGLKVHLTSQDAICLKLPAKENMIPLDQLVHYAAYPKEAIENLSDKRKEVERDIYRCLYGNNRFDRDVLTSATATEIRDGRTGTNNTLSKYAANISEIYRHIVTTCAALKGNAEGLTVSHKYPSDFKLESVNELLLMRKCAIDAHAPYEVIASIDQAILSKQCRDDKSTLHNVEVKEKFKPFKTKSEQERLSVVSLLADDDPYKVLYCYFDEILEEVLFEQNNFATMNYLEQKRIVFEKVDAFIEKQKERDEASRSDFPVLVRDASNRGDG